MDARRTVQRCLGPIAAVALCLSAAAVSAQSATNVIFLIGDGMGLQQVEAGRCFKGGALVFEAWTDSGLAMTRSASSEITDSAASCTALATGHKANNGVVSVALPGDGGEYETLLEYFKAKGKRTGLVTTTYMTDATPACFGAHASSRGLTADIASDYLYQTVPNVLFGGGGSGMTITGAVAAGYTVVTNRGGLLAPGVVSNTLVSSQFGNGNMPYEHDGLGDLPHLSEMTRVAIDILSRGTNGFFLMVEGGRIDHACHAKDIVRCVRETAEFDNAVGVVTNWAAGRNDTLLLVTADHECGGLEVLADNGPGVEPDVSWSSGGHTASNVGVYAWGPKAGLFKGTMDNTAVYSNIVCSYLFEGSAGGMGLDGGGALAITWNVRSNDVFRLEASDSLIRPDWVPVGTATAIEDIVEIADTNVAPRSSRYYRLFSVR